MNFPLKELIILDIWKIKIRIKLRNFKFLPVFHITLYTNMHLFSLYTRIENPNHRGHFGSGRTDERRGINTYVPGSRLFDGPVDSGSLKRSHRWLQVDLLLLRRHHYRRRPIFHPASESSRVGTDAPRQSEVVSEVNWFYGVLLLG